MTAPNRGASPRLVAQLPVGSVGIRFPQLLVPEDWRRWEAWAYGSTYSLGSAVSLALAAKSTRTCTPSAPAARRGALARIVEGFALATSALVANRFLSGMVRIRAGRGHHVVSSGPYRWVRHPVYAGAPPTYFASAVLLDSVWALVPAAVIAAVPVVRTKLEDEARLSELYGYRACSERTRYRLLPGVW